jgi:hypothetical protein
LKAFLELANYYYKFVKRFNWITTPSIVESWICLLVNLVKKTPNLDMHQKDHSIIFDKLILICALWFGWFFWLAEYGLFDWPFWLVIDW